MRGAAIQQRDGAVLQVRQYTAVDDCENIATNIAKISNDGDDDNDDDDVIASVVCSISILVE